MLEFENYVSIDGWIAQNDIVVTGVSYCNYNYTTLFLDIPDQIGPYGQGPYGAGT